ncbi:MAG: glycosyltransferase [Patescibacteria group bacterium]|nr:glycosyltransferase [Patescibacteria group bacterium]
MKIALVHDHLNQIGGAEKVLFCFNKIFPQAPIYTLIYDQKRLNDFFKDLNIQTSFIQNLPWAFSKFKWYLPLMPSAIEQLNLNNYDVVLSDASAFAKGVITKPGSIHVCYCHTPTRYLWTDTHNYIEEVTKNKVIKKVLPLILNQLRSWDQSAAQRVDYFIANSNFVAQRIKKYYHKDSHVIYPPVEVEKFKIQPKQDKYFLIVSRLRPYKKVDLAIKAFNRLRMPLKIIGVGEEEAKLKKIAKDNIEFLGGVSDKVKAQYMARAQALIHPQEEDFGITAVESMAAGRPVIAYKAGGAMETVKAGETGVFFNEPTWESLTEAVIRFNPQDFSSRVIQEHAQQFSRERFEKEIKDFIHRAWQDKLI